MKNLTFILALFFTLSEYVSAQVNADFTIPDTVCVNAKFPVKNLTTGGSTYYWNFCSGNLLNTPVGGNLGNTGTLDGPVYVAFAKDGKDCFSFITNHYSGTLTRNYYGSSFSNNPVSVNLGNLGKLPSPDYIEGIQIKKCNGIWYGLIAGGMHQYNIFLLTFGSSLFNTPVVTDLGNINDKLSYPHTLYAFQEKGNWYCFVGNNLSSSIVRLNFGNSLANPPTAVDLGNVGGLNTPVGFFPILDKGTWYLFVVNTKDNTLSRLNFGNSLTNKPTGVNLGKISSLDLPRSITMVHDCGQIIGFLVNQTNTIVRLTFPNGVTSIPYGESMGNIAKFSFPHQISEVFRENDTLYMLVTNVNNNTLSRLYFPGCSNSSLASSNLKNPPLISYNSPGTYNINLTVNEGLPSQVNLCKQIVVAPLPDIKVNPNPADICTGSSATLTASGADFYEWAPPSGLNKTSGPLVIANPATSITYTVTGTSSGCRSSAAVAVNVNPKPIVKVNPGSVTVCSGNSATLTASGADVYSWSPSAGLSSDAGAIVVASPSVTTTYTVTGILNGCSASSNVIIAVINKPSLSLSPSSATICQGNSVTLTAGGAGSYSWSPSENLNVSYGPSVIASPMTNTTFSVTGTSNGCSATGNIIVNVSNSPTVKVNPDASVICAGNSVTLSASGANTYSWSPSAGLNAVTGASVIASPLSTTTYIVTGTSNNCSDSKIVIVSVNPKPIVKISSNAIKICSGGSVTLTANGGDTYYWSPAAGLSSITGNPVIASPVSTATYSVTGTLNGCSASANIKITVNAKSTVIPNVNSTNICSGNSATLEVFGADSYTWSPAYGLNTASGSVVVANPDVSTTYIVTGITNGCSNTDTIKVNVIPKPSVSINPNHAAICSGSSVTITASGANKFLWAPSAGLSAASGSTITANPVASTTYTVTGTLNGCSNTSSIAIDVINKPDIKIISGAPYICSGKSNTLTAIGADSYTWSSEVLPNPVVTNSLIVSPSVTSVYYVTGTLNGCSNSSSISVSVNPNPVISLSPNPVSVCPGFSASLTASGADTYLWSPAEGLNKTSGANVIAGPVVSTTYYVTGTKNGCSNTSSVIVNISNNLNITVNPNPAKICSGNSVTLTAYGADSFLWSPDAGLNSNNVSSVIAKPSSSVNYTVTGTSNGCSNTAVVKVIVLNKPAVFINPANPSVCEGNTVTLHAGGADSYFWAPADGLSSASGASVSANPSKTCVFSVTGSANGCSNSADITVTVIPKPKLSVNPNPALICKGSSATLTASGADAYVWSPVIGLNASSGKSVIASPDVSTVYSITGTSNGCYNTANVTVNITDKPNISINPAFASVCPGSSVTLSASGADNYKWSPAETLNTASGSTVIASPAVKTSYTVTGSINNCSNSATVVIDVKNKPAVTIIPVNPVICPGNSITLTASGADSYSWSSVDLPVSVTSNTLVVSPSVTNDYSVTGIANGCANSASITVKVNQKPSLSIYPNPASVCIGNPVTLTASGAESYIWTSEVLKNPEVSNSVIVSPSITSIFSVKGTLNGCSDSVNVNVFVKNKPIVLIYPDTAYLCAGNSVTLTASGADSYSWYSEALQTPIVSNAIIVSPEKTSVFTVTGYLNSCSNTANANVFVIPKPEIIINPNPASVCQSNSITLSASGADSYTWTSEAFLKPVVSNTVIASPEKTTVFKVAGLLNGCSDTTDIIVTVLQKPLISVETSDVRICEGESVTLNAAGAETFSWSPPDGLNSFKGASVIATPSVTSTYIVSGTDKNGCSSESDVVIIVDTAFQITAMPDKVTLCKGSSVTLSVSGAESYKWLPSTGLNTSSGACVTANPSSSVVYKVIGSSSGCSDTLLVSVNVIPNPVAAFTINPEIVSTYDPPVSFSDKSWGNPPPVKWHWSLGNGETRNSRNFNYKFDQSGKYLITLTAFNQFGCIDSTSKYLIVQSEFTLYVPNAFRPDNYINNIFYAYGTGLFGFNLKIFDRWGNMIFESKDINFGWNGKYNGNPQPQGTYVYLIDFYDSEGKQHKKFGNVSLLR